MFLYLFRNREKPPRGSTRWLKVWIKRLYHAPAILQLAWARQVLVWKGANIAELVIISKVTLIGDARNLTINAGAFLGGPIEINLQSTVSIGKRTIINSGVRLFTGTHDLDDESWRLISRPIVIEDDAWIASGAMVLPGSRIERMGVLGAGSVLRGSIPSHSVYFGNPARASRIRKTLRVKINPLAGSAAFEAWLGPPW